MPAARTARARQFTLASDQLSGGGGGGGAWHSTCAYPECVEPSHYAADSTCTGCRSARYCTRACQKADWKRHKPACKAAAAANEAAARAGALEPARAPTPAHSVVLDLHASGDPAPGESGDLIHMARDVKTDSFRRGPWRAPTVRPNIHGSARFVVKVQTPLGGGALLNIYDETRSLQTFAEAPALAAAVERFGGGWPKTYLWATREGDSLRVYTDAAAPTPEW